MLEINTGTWAIHGDIPVDGEVLLAEYHMYDEAKYALDEIEGEMRPADDP